MLAKVYATMIEIKEEVISSAEVFRELGGVSPLEPGGEDFMGKAMYVYSTLAKFKVVQSYQGQDENRTHYVVVYPNVQYCFQKCGRKTNEKKDEDSP